MILNWWQGQLPWWAALLVLGLAYRTLIAVMRMKRYRAWAKEWNAVVGETTKPAAPSSEAKAGRKSRLLPVSAVLFFVLLVCLAMAQNSPSLASALRLFWVVDAVLLLYAVVRRSRQRRSLKASAAPVTWMLGRASSSPSRAAAQRQLPEYTLRLLMDGNAEAPRLKAAKRGQQAAAL